MQKITLEKIKSYFYELQDRLLAFIWKKSLKFSEIDGHILMYHHVTEQPIDEIPSCVRTVNEFIEGLEEERKAGYSIIPIGDFLESNNLERHSKFCVVTFDDVPSNFYYNAYPYLKKNNIPFTLFITTNYLENKDYLSQDQIKQLDTDPLCTIGAHTLSHPMLRRCENPFAELLESKKKLEQILGHEIKYMAYPYGKHSSISNRIRRLASKAGYRYAFSTIDAPITDITLRYKYFLPRIIL